MVSVRRVRGGTVLCRILSEVAAADHCDELDLPPLYETIDPDALEQLLESDGLTEVGFEYHGYQVTVDGQGGVQIGPA